MPSYLLIWNPASLKWNEEDTKATQAQVDAGESSQGQNMSSIVLLANS